MLVNLNLATGKSKLDLIFERLLKVTVLFFRLVIGPVFLSH
jgi:hypothetical protein